MQDPADEAFQQAAATFAACVDAGEEARVERATLFHHMAVLNILARGHSLRACRHYAGSAVIPWGRFGSLDSLRTVILRAPEVEAAGIAPFPATVPELDVLPFHHPGAEAVVFVFTGRAHQFGAPLSLIHPWFRTLGTSVVYVFDMDLTYYLGPLRGLGASIEANVAALRSLMAGLGATRCCCVGNSGGGFGALLYAPLLGARRSLAFSPPTMIRESLDQVRGKVPDLDRLVAANGAVDLRLLYAARGTWPPARIFYPASLERDSEEARNLAGLAGIALNPVDLAKHNLIPHLIASDAFQPELAWLVAEDEGQTG